YVQFDPFIKDSLYEESEIDFDKGFAVSGSDEEIAVVTMGVWAHNLKKANIPAKVIDCFALPVCESAFCEEIAKCKKIVTIEDGVSYGGLGSLVLEILNDHNMTIPVKRMALEFKDGYPEVFSDREAVFESEGLTMDRLMAELKGGEV
ncbi:MAG: hypothetical protein K5840_02040, partial [Eubacterium sp.]|nr:hypothetical protein [Eubacterium sp.]